MVVSAWYEAFSSTGRVPLLITFTVLDPAIGPPTSTAPNDTPTAPGSSAFSANTWLLSAAAASTRPAPTRCGPYTTPFAAVLTSASAVFITAALTSSGVQPGCACSTRAAMPVVCGVAMDVPLNTATLLPLPDNAEA